NKRIASLKNKKSLIKIVRYSNLRSNTMVEVLESILNKEGIDYDPGVLKIIVAESGGDMRGAINDLENLGYGQNRINGANLSVLKNRDRLTDKYEGIQHIFRSKTPLGAHEVTRNLDLNFEFLIMWVYQNAYKWAGTPAELSEMYRYVALANLYRSRIYRNQYWKLLKYYFFFLSAGVNHAMKTPYTFKKIDWPVWGKVRRPPEEVRSEFERIAEKNRMSMDKFYKETLPYLKMIFQSNTGKAYQLAESYLLSKETIAELAGDSFSQYKDNKAFVELWKSIKEKTTVQEKRKVKIKALSPKSKKKTTKKIQQKPDTGAAIKSYQPEKKSPKKSKITTSVNQLVALETVDRDELPPKKSQIKKQKGKETETPVIKDKDSDEKAKDNKKAKKAKSASLGDFFKV
ncbi:MAG: hypothetical protein ACFFD4_20710, partial [Candidatus Odinarchaeota archaeon]